MAWIWAETGEERPTQEICQSSVWRHLFFSVPRPIARLPSAGRIHSFTTWVSLISANLRARWAWFASSERSLTGSAAPEGASEEAVVAFEASGFESRGLLPRSRGRDRELEGIPEHMGV